MTAEHQRLADNAGKTVPLVEWGPYLSERQWGTVREDYSTDGNAWHYFPFDHAAYRSYIWGKTAWREFPTSSKIFVLL